MTMRRLIIMLAGMLMLWAAAASAQQPTFSIVGNPCSQTPNLGHAQWCFDAATAPTHGAYYWNGSGWSAAAVAACTSGTTPASAGAGCNFTTLSSAQIKGLDLTPRTIVGAAGANTIIIPMAALIQGKFGTRAYLPEPAGLIEFAYNTVGNASTAIAAYSDNIGGGNAIFSNTASAIAFTNTMGVAIAGSAWTVGSAVGLTVSPPSTIVNQPLVVGLSGGDTYNAGPITAVTIAAAGLGYAPNDTFNIDPTQTLSDSADATGHVTSIGGGGAVTGVAINNAGVSYAVTTANAQTGPYPTVHTSGAGNNALTLNVTGATTGDGTGSITVWYVVGTLQ